MVCDLWQAGLTNNINLLLLLSLSDHCASHVWWVCNKDSLQCKLQLLKHQMAPEVCSNNLAVAVSGLVDNIMDRISESVYGVCHRCYTSDEFAQL